MSKTMSFVSKDHKVVQRKVFMITEKSATNDKSQNGMRNNTNAGGSCQKRKMILIMDEKPQVEIKCSAQDIENDGSTKRLKLNNENTSSPSVVATSKVAPKLLLLANSVDNQLSQKIEEILPEILNRVQWKSKCGDTANLRESIESEKSNKDTSFSVGFKTQKNQSRKIPHENGIKDNSSMTDSNLMLLGAAAASKASTGSSNPNHNSDEHKVSSLPPKKNFSKFRKEQEQHGYNSNTNEVQRVAPTPVIVSAMSLKSMEQQFMNNGNSCSSNTFNYFNTISKPHKLHSDQQIHNQFTNYNNTSNDLSTDASSDTSQNNPSDPIVVKQQNINLSGDFLFLMKMLPILEEIQEPRKTQVKILIDKILKQCLANDTSAHNNNK